MHKKPIKVLFCDDQPGMLDYADPSVAPATDSITLRATVPNPLRSGTRGLIDGAFVGVMVEGAEPIQALSVPRAALMSDQQGSFVYIVDAEKKIQPRRVTLGQSTPALAAIASGLQPGDQVVVDGLQRLRPGAVVNPVPAGGPPGGAPPAAQPRG